MAEERPVQAVTFVATSNNVQPTSLKDVEFEGQLRAAESERPLRTVLLKSRTMTAAFTEQDEQNIQIIQASARNSDSNPNPNQANVEHDQVITASWGLVGAIVDAYNKHHCLILRPDDVWQAILTQFSFYVNANAEDLRDCFVDFQGKKTLVIEMEPGNLFSTNFGKFANRMVDEQITKNIKDPEVTKWLLPDFTTTTTHDRVAASVTIMSTLQAYFEYVCGLLCGIPKVTMEGTVQDWKLLRQKIDRLLQYDIDGRERVMRKWHSLLVPVLDNFVASVEGNPDLEFWDTVCHHSGGGSGPRYLSGWVTVFACFKAKVQTRGKRKRSPQETSCWQGDVPDRPPRGNGYKWPFIETGKLPVGAVSVPVLVDDNGTQYDTQMLAGQFGYEMVPSSSNNDDNNVKDTVRPRTDWCIAYEGTPKEVPRNYKHEEILPSENHPQNIK